MAGVFAWFLMVAHSDIEILAKYGIFLIDTYGEQA